MNVKTAAFLVETGSRFLISGLANLTEAIFPALGILNAWKVFPALGNKRKVFPRLILKCFSTGALLLLELSLSRQ